MRQHARVNSEAIACVVFNVNYFVDKCIELCPVYITVLVFNYQAGSSTICDILYGSSEDPAISIIHVNSSLPHRSRHSKLRMTKFKQK